MPPLIAKYLSGVDREHFVVVMLSTAAEVIGINTAHVGSLDCSIVSPREVFKPAILANASRIIVAHNHPSGNLTPSPADVQVSKQLQEAGKLLDIPLLDSLVIGYDGEFTSLRERGVLS